MFYPSSHHILHRSLSLPRFSLYPSYQLCNAAHAMKTKKYHEASISTILTVSLLALLDLVKHTCLAEKTRLLRYLVAAHRFHSLGDNQPAHTHTHTELKRLTLSLSLSHSHTRGGGRRCGISVTSALLLSFTLVSSFCCSSCSRRRFCAGLDARVMVFSDRIEIA